MLALHQELGRDVSGRFDFAGFLILLMELLNPLFSRHHLQGSKISERNSRDEEKNYAIDPTFFQGTIPFSLTLTMEELGTTIVPTMLLIRTLLATFCCRDSSRTTGSMLHLLLGHIKRPLYTGCIDLKTVDWL